MNQYLILIIGAVWAYWVMQDTVKKTKGDGDLTQNEVIQVVITLIISTLPAFVIYYFGWKDKLPKKTAHFKRLLNKVILILVGIGALGILGAIALVAMKPNR